jgi:hypothetical protein
VKLLRTALSNPALARVLSAWASASLSTWAFTILFALAAYNAGGATALGLAVLVRTLPAALAAPYGAVLADRHSRRTVLLAGLVARATLLTGLAIALMADVSLPVICVLGGLFTLAGVAHRPAQSALITAVARTPAELAAANVLTSSLEYVGFLAGALVVGAAAGPIGVNLAMLISVVPLVAAALVVAGVPPDQRPEALPDAVTDGVLHEMLGGLRTVRGDPGLTVLTVIVAVDLFVQGLIDVLLIIAALEALDIGQSGAGWLNAGWGLGGLLGGAASLALLHRGQLSRGLVLGCVLAGIPFALLAAVGSLAPALGLLVVLGIGFAVTEIALSTFTQRLASDDVLGRVFGLQETLFGCSAIGSLAASGAVSLLGLKPTLVAAGLLLPVVALALRRPLLALEAEAAVPERTFALIRAVPLFAPLPIARVETVAVRASMVEHGAGETIVTEGAPGDTFYVIDTGTVDVTLRGAPVCTRGPGEFFGEIALVQGTVRTATVCAAEAVRLITLERDDFLDSIGAHPRCTHTAHTVADARLETAVKAAPV